MRARMDEPTLKRVKASSSWGQWLHPRGDHPACVSGYCEARLMDANASLRPSWHAGPPVTLELTLSAPAARVGFCPELRAEGAEVGLVLVDAETGRRTAFLGQWRDGVWCDIALDAPAQRLRVEFVSSERAPIALRAVRFFSSA